MDSRFKQLVKLLWEDQVSVERLARELSPFRPTMEKSEADQVASQTVSRLHREWLAKRPACN